MLSKKKLVDVAKLPVKSKYIDLSQNQCQWFNCESTMRHLVFEHMVAQPTLTNWRVRIYFYVKLVIVYSANRYTALIGTKDCHQVLCETLQVHTENFAYGKDGS